MGKIKLLAAGVVVNLLMVAALLVARPGGCGSRNNPSSSTGGAGPLGFAPPKTETTKPWFSLGPKRRADEVLKGAPAGSRMVELPPSDEPSFVFITPAGEVLTPQGTGTIYVKPPAFIKAEVRPWVGAGVVWPFNVAAAAGVDLVKIGPLHGGPGLCVAPGAVSGVLGVSYGLWRNVDLRAAGGYGTAGPAAFAGVDIAIQ